MRLRLFVAFVLISLNIVLVNSSWHQPAFMLSVIAGGVASAVGLLLIFFNVVTSIPEKGA